MDGNGTGDGKQRKRRGEYRKPLFSQSGKFRRLTDAEWEDIYIRAAFPPPWDAVFHEHFHRLRSQYVPEGVQAAQYEVLVWRISALTALLQKAESEHDEIYNILAIEDRLLKEVQAVQRYTEAERRISVEIDARVEETIRMCIAIADVIISDPHERQRFYSALISRVQGEPIEEWLQLSPGDTDKIIEGNGHTQEG